MAQRTITANLTAEVFPFDFRELSSTIVNTDILNENRKISGGFSGEGAERSAGISQAYFLQNVLPITRGYSSAHFKKVLPGVNDASSLIDNAYVISDALNNIALYSPANGNNVIFDPEDQRWFQEENIQIISENVSVALFKNVTYVCYPGVGLFTYDFANKVLELATVEGINFANVKGVTSAGSQLILWTEDTLYWSSVLDPLDFTPSQENGAGTTQILDLKGVIICCKPLDNGFIIYSTKNMVGAQATGNFAFPWSFKEIPNSIGIASHNHVGANHSSGFHLVWTVSGFMQVSYREVSPVWGELSEAIQRGIVIKSNAENIPSIFTYNKLDVKVKMIGTEYIVVSTKNTEDAFYESAYVYDIILRRWGRLDVPHADFIEYSIPQFERQLTFEDFGDLYLRFSSIPEDLTFEDLGSNQDRQPSIPGKNLGCVAPDGSVFTVELATDLFPAGVTSADPEGYLEAAAKRPAILLGKYKFQRTHGIRLEWLNIANARELDLTAISHDYSGNFVSVKSDFTEHPRVAGRYYGRMSGDSISLLMQGIFVLTDLYITVGDSGKTSLPSSPRFKQVVIEQVPVVIDGNPVTGDWQ